MKKTLIIISYFLIIVVVSATVYINLSPQFGTNPSNSQKKKYENFDNYNNGEFKNLDKFKMMTGEMSMVKFFKSDPMRRPKFDLIHDEIDLKTFLSSENSKIKISWLGHSAFILNIDGMIVMLDPMLGDYASPLPLPSLKRYSSNIAFPIENIDTIDVVVFSHDHYDHLNYSSIQKIKNKVRVFYVPYGMGNHLKGWGVKSESIIELNWGNSKINNGVEFFCLPALHFSGRGILNRNSTLWCSWAIICNNGTIYFSGDSGYGSHFKKIGEQYGPFDISLIDCGQYNSAWKYSHMTPEQAVQAAQELTSTYFMPIHWGGFTLSTHSWTEPVRRALEYAEKSNQKIITPRLGQIVYLDNNNDHLQTNYWWNKYY